MKEWNLGPERPLSLTLAADARLTHPDYFNDHIWTVDLYSGEPPALSLFTSYGLRARMMRVFPRFIIDKTAYSDSTKFYHPPHLVQFFPNFLKFSFSLLNGLDVTSEYWVPDSQVICGQFHIFNRNVNPVHLHLNMISILSPLDEGQAMQHDQVQSTTILYGATGNLRPVLMLSGGPEPGIGPFPSLSIPVDLAPENENTITWALASKENLEASINCARDTLSKSWEAETARVDLLNQYYTIGINTGDVDWDAAIAMSQKVAYSLIMGPDAKLPNRSFVLSRQPDLGFSMREDGSDYTFLWSGQSALDTWYLNQLLLPGGSQISQGILQNFISTQVEDGSIDWRPGLAGQRGSLLSTPILATITWEIFETNRDLDFLDKNYLPLIKFYNRWFQPDHDRDNDGIPEWDHLLQTGITDHPFFDRWHLWSQGVDITTVESPSLISFLYAETISLLKIAKVLGHKGGTKLLKNNLLRLRTALEETWDQKKGTYCYRDRDTHLSESGQLIHTFSGDGQYKVNTKFSKPYRLGFKIHSRGETTRHTEIQISGRSSSGIILEKITSKQLQWNLSYASGTSQHTFSRIDTIEFVGLGLDDEVNVFTYDYTIEDISLLLPLWAGIPNSRRARDIITKTVLSENRYLYQYGLVACPFQRSSMETPICGKVNLLMSQFVLSGLLRYGYRKEAADIFSKIMIGIIQILKREHCFRESFRADNGNPDGETNSLGGLVPIKLFLDILGIKILRPDTIVIQDQNPFPWNVTISYRGTTIIRREKETFLNFLDGQTITITGEGSHEIHLG